MKQTSQHTPGPWEAFSDDPTKGELCGGGLRYYTKLDEFGVPILTETTRAAIVEAMENQQP